MFTFPTGLFVPSQAGDPFWANVVFLQNFQGTNGSKPATDQSQYAHALTWNGDAVISTAQSPFAGGSSVYFDGNGDYVNILYSSTLYFGAGDFTFEIWIRNAGASQQFARYFTTRGNDSYSGLYMVTSGLTSRDLIYSLSNNGTSFAASGTITSSATDGIWYYVAITRSGSLVKTWLNGSEIETVSNASPLFDGGDNFQIGGQAGTPRTVNAYIGPLRITKGVARNVSTVPTAPFPTGP